MLHQPSETFVAAAPRREIGWALRQPIPSRWLIAALAAYLGLAQLLLWRFLDVMPAAAYAGGALLIVALCWMLARDRRGDDAVREPTIATFLCCLAVAAAVLILGGEGRLFYANIDWQVRDAVLRDMSIHPWPFAYMSTGEPAVLRAPLGMYLVPSLFYKAWGPVAGDWALLTQNALLVASVLALAASLFPNARQRAVALLIVVAFSGLDVIGMWLTHLRLDHMENWLGVQLSSTITLAFWVPQHALAGWIGAVLFLRWRDGHLPLLAMLAMLPLAALWSPLSAIGWLPFLAFAGVRELWRGKIALPDFAGPALSTLLAAPTLVYLSAAGGRVGVRPYPLSARGYLLFETLEVLVYLVPLAVIALRRRIDAVTLAIVALCLLAAPLIQIGGSVDFGMRASIPALAILAVLIARFLLGPRDTEDRLMKAWLVVVLCIGSATGASEIRRALTHPPSPRGKCSIFGAALMGFPPGPFYTYVAPLKEMPALVRPSDPPLISAVEPQHCWPGTWYHPVGV